MLKRDIVVSFWLKLALKSENCRTRCCSCTRRSRAASCALQLLPQIGFAQEAANPFTHRLLIPPHYPHWSERRSARASEAIGASTDERSSAWAGKDATSCANRRRNVIISDKNDPFCCSWLSEDRRRNKRDDVETSSPCCVGWASRCRWRSSEKHWVDILQSAWSKGWIWRNEVWMDVSVAVETNFPLDAAQPAPMKWMLTESGSVVSNCAAVKHIWGCRGWQSAMGLPKMENGGETLSKGLLLTAVGYSKTVGHLQVVNMGCESEFQGAKLNHSYPKRAVLLIRASWKKPPWYGQNSQLLSSHTSCERRGGYSGSELHNSSHLVWADRWRLLTYLNTGRASERAAP